MGLLSAVPVAVFAPFRHQDVNDTVALAASTSDALDLLDGLLRHVVKDDEVDFSNVKALLTDGR